MWFEFLIDLFTSGAKLLALLGVFCVVFGIIIIANSNAFNHLFAGIVFTIGGAICLVVYFRKD
jgi:uncharacterized membrane protein HdeD (DUF308 family)